MCERWVAAKSVACPACPHCGMPVLVPIEAADWNHRAPEGSRLACPACGGGCVGTEAEVQQAREAQRAWESIR